MKEKGVENKNVYNTHESLIERERERERQRDREA